MSARLSAGPVSYLRLVAMEPHSTSKVIIPFLEVKRILANVWLWHCPTWYADTLSLSLSISLSLSTSISLSVRYIARLYMSVGASVSLRIFCQRPCKRVYLCACSLCAHSGHLRKAMEKAGWGPACRRTAAKASENSFSYGKTRREGIPRAFYNLKH